MFQIKNIIISFFVIATAISGTHANTCLADKNDECPPSFSSRGTFTSSNKGSSLDKKLICSNNNNVNFDSDTIDCPKSHKKHRSLIEGKSCMVSGNTACPTNFASRGSIYENTLCCLTIGEDSSCGSISFDASGSSTPMCTGIPIESIPSTEDMSSAGSASIFALTTSFIITPFVIMMLMN